MDQSSMFEELMSQMMAARRLGTLDRASEERLLEILKECAGCMDSVTTIEEMDHNRARLDRLLTRLRPYRSSRTQLTP